MSLSEGSDERVRWQFCIDLQLGMFKDLHPIRRARQEDKTICQIDLTRLEAVFVAPSLLEG